MSWKKTITTVDESAAPVEPKKGSSWKDTIQDAPPDELDSAARGLAQGASMGFADEISGGVEALWEKAKGDPTAFGELYKAKRDESRANFKKAEEANPKSYMAGQIGGAIGTAIVPGLGGAGLAKLAAQGAVQGLGASEADLTDPTLQNIGQAAKDTAIGAGTGALAAGAGKVLSKIPVGKVASSAAQKIGGTLDDAAESLAVKATGATGNQASKFADDAGRQLLDRNLVRIGDTAENISDRLAKSISGAESHIDDALSKLDAQGVTASADDVVTALENKVAELSKDPSQAGAVRKLRSVINDIIETGNSQVPVSEAEATKRGFNKMAGNWMDPEAGVAGKQAYGAYKDVVEEAAQKANPELAEQFTKAKADYGLMAPIQEAAEKRAMQQAQKSPISLRDVVSTVAGGPKGFLLNKASEQIEKRAVSTAAVVTNNLAKAVKDAPQQFGRFAPMLQKAAQRGGNSLAATDFVLQQTQPEYRELKKGLGSGEDENGQ